MRNEVALNSGEFEMLGVILPVVCLKLYLMCCFVLLLGY